MSYDNVDEVIVCPACGSEMVKIFMPNQGVNIDVCLNGCGGIFFDNRELEKFDENHEDIETLLEAYKNKTFTKKTDETQKRVCPVCGWDMVKHYASSLHEIEIDDCYNCGGKFLDNEELIKYRSQFNTEAQRNEAAVQELYNAAGEELNEFNKKYAKNIDNLNLVSKSIINVADILNHLL